MRRLESHSWWPELLALKDDRSLRQLAEQFGVTPGAISAAFRRQNVARKHARSGPRQALDSDGLSARPDRLAAFGDLLGQVSDKEIAKRTGLSVRAVSQYRREHQIEEQGTRLMMWGWRVVFDDGLSRVLFATDAHQVLAMMGGLGSVVHLERLAPAWSGPRPRSSQADAHDQADHEPAWSQSADLVDEE